ncbi:MAG: family 20 glycosylhydrolase [Microbacterium sp.]
MSLPLIPLPASVTEQGGVLEVGEASSRDTAAETAWGGATTTVDTSLAPGAYSLNIDDDGLRVRAGADAGLRHARATLAQLLIEGDGWSLPHVAIDDAPRFTYRGMMLDVARHFFGVEVVTWLIDRLAELKLTHLHLHVTDDQGWRLQLDSRPELASDESFSHADWTAILGHARKRGITIVPEIDLPGHTHAVGLAYPELAADPVITDHIREIVETCGGGLPQAGVPYTGMAVGFSSLRAGSQAVRDFLTDVLTEVCALTPGPLVHIGGDEALGTDPADYAELVGFAASVVTAAGKTPVTWHEAGRVPLPSGTIGQYWGFTTANDDETDRVRAFVENGGKVILSPADAIYLDMKYDDASPLGLIWANGPTSLERSYSWTPETVVPGLPDEAILGVEAALWTETILTRADIERMVFPRIASAAEHAWSPAGASSWPDFRERLECLAAQWSSTGLGAEPLT